MYCLWQLVGRHWLPSCRLSICNVTDVGHDGYVPLGISKLVCTFVALVIWPGVDGALCRLTEPGRPHCAVQCHDAAAWQSRDYSK